MFVQGAQARRYAEEDENEAKSGVRYILSAINWVTREIETKQEQSRKEILKEHKAAKQAFTADEKKQWGKRIDAYGKKLRKWETMGVKDLYREMREGVNAWQKKGAKLTGSAPLGDYNFFVWDLLNAVSDVEDDKTVTIKFIGAQLAEVSEGKFTRKVVDKMFEAKVDSNNVGEIVNGLILFAKRFGPQGATSVAQAVEIMAYALANWLGYGFYFHHLPPYGALLQLGGDAYRETESIVYRFPILNEIIGIRPLDGELESIRKGVQNWPYNPRWKVVFPSDFDNGYTHYVSKYQKFQELNGNALTAEIFADDKAIRFTATRGGVGDQLTARIGEKDDPETGTTIVDEEEHDPETGAVIVDKENPRIFPLSSDGGVKGGPERQMYSSADTSLYSARNDRPVMDKINRRQF